MTREKNCKTLRWVTHSTTLLRGTLLLDYTAVMTLNSGTDDLEQKEEMNLDTELTTTLAPELKHHFLTYLESPTLLNYSQCSKIANFEVQPLNTNPPRELMLIEGDNGITVVMKYGAMQNHQNTVSKKFGFSDKTMDDIRAHLLKYYKYSRNKRTDSMRIIMKTWPVELLELEHLSEIADWQVTMFPSMYDGFMSNIKNCRNIVKKLSLGEPAKGSQDLKTVCKKVEIGKEFFKSSFFKNLSEADLQFVRSEIDEIDFMEAKHQLLSMAPNTISINAIQAKVENMNNTHYSKDSEVTISSIHSNMRHVHRYVLFPANRFPQRIHGDLFTLIGRVEVTNDRGPHAIKIIRKKDI